MSKTIGVLTPLIDGFYFNGMLQGIHEATKNKDINLILFQTMDSNYLQVAYQSNLADNNIDGWIVIYNGEKDDSYVSQIEQKGRPVVSTPYDWGTACTVFQVDNEQGGYEATKHLIEHGHTKIASVYCIKNEESILRFKGYKKALEENGIPFDEQLVFEIPTLWEYDGVRAAHMMKDRSFGFTAITVSSDLVALAIIQQFKEWEIHVPDDIAIIGFDNTEYARRIGLTSVEQPLFTRGVHMAETLIRELNGYLEGFNQQIFEPTNLIVRHSCGCTPLSKEEDMDHLYEESLEIINYLHNIVQRNQRICRDLIRSKAGYVIDLSWLSSTSYTWGCVALWTSERQLRIESIHTSKSDSILHAGQIFPEKIFPPSSIYSLLEIDEALSVHTIRTEERELGFVLLMGTINEKLRSAHPQYDTITHHLDLLAYALEREAMYKEASERERRLEIVSSTTNDGIFEWDLSTNVMTWNHGIKRILNHTSHLMHLDEFFNKLHEDDRIHVHQALFDHIQAGRSFKTEFRMKKNEKEYIWVSAAGEVVREQDGRFISMIGSITDITERKASEEQIRHIAFHDSLTNLPNRRYIYQKISDEIKNVEAVKFAILLLDLDRFKIINDSLGHTIGDKLIQQISDVLDRVIRPQDTVSRLGGDEFIILCPNLEDELQAVEVAERIILALNKRFNIEGHSIYVTSSIGISYYPKHGCDVDTLIKNADIAMYEAKSNGKNQYMTYEKVMSYNTLQRLRMENSLRDAVKGNEFTLYYQAQMSLKTQRIVGMEALIRWFSPEFGLVSPVNFIPLAEETGLIIPISEWVLQQACEDNKKLISEGFPPLVIAVNISASHFTKHDFVSTIISILEKTGHPPHLLCLEITETVAIQHLDLTLRHLYELKKYGIRIALDDFGVGNSSLSLLRTLPIDTLKTDQSFVRDLMKSEANMAIYRSILSLAQGLNLESCIEGVETVDHYRLVEEEGGTMIQGYYISKPVPLDQFKQFLSQQTY
ncbi:EAL domain-containing protein [Bacillus alkalicellulosilyticus]|uniref:EAL domain-containing protein n=1 Tax=Alkalihalobacterium alkalicellulosilyticum TaxID=1912214 RepID=UPI0009982695|nr:EAL domain-containing protein [Bacillus alkalicellulosilyticus]